MGNYYEGYWTILGTEHRIIEEERNSQLYTTILHLGTDSLGYANKWTDGSQIIVPSSKPARTIIPGVRQTNIVPKTSLNKTTINAGPQNTGNFSQATNRSKPLVNNRTVSAPTWKTGTKTLNPITQPATSTAPTINRLLTKIPKVL